jgi:hypothetical protein
MKINKLVFINARPYSRLFDRIKLCVEVVLGTENFLMWSGNHIRKLLRMCSHASFEQEHQKVFVSNFLENNVSKTVSTFLIA